MYNIRRYFAIKPIFPDCCIVLFVHNLAAIKCIIGLYNMYSQPVLMIGFPCQKIMPNKLIGLLSLTKSFYGFACRDG